MLTIHHPIPFLKAGASGIAILATGFYGTFSLLHVINLSDGKTADTQSKTTRKQTDTKASANTSATASAGAQQKDEKGLSPIATNSTASSSTDVDDIYAAPAAQLQPAPAVTSGASGATSVQVQSAPTVSSATTPTSTSVSSPTQTSTSTITSPTQSTLGNLVPTVQTTLNATGTTQGSLLP